LKLPVIFLVSVFAKNGWAVTGKAKHCQECQAEEDCGGERMFMTCKAEDETDPG